MFMVQIEAGIRTNPIERRSPGGDVRSCSGNGLQMLLIGSSSLTDPNLSFRLSGQFGCTKSTPYPALRPHYGATTGGGRQVS